MTLIDFSLLVAVIGVTIFGTAHYLFHTLFPPSYWRDRMKTRIYKLTKKVRY